MTEMAPSEFLDALRALPLYADGWRSGSVQGEYIAYHAHSGVLHLDGEFTLPELVAIHQWTVECLAVHVAETHGHTSQSGPQDHR